MTRPQDHEALWATLVDGELTPDEFAQLQSLLAADPAARRRYIDLMLLDTLLSEDLAAESIGDMVDTLSPPATLPLKSQPAAKLEAPGGRRRWFATAGAAAAAIVLGAFLWSLTGPEKQASAAMLVTETLKVHQLPLDRCYMVEVERAREASWFGQARPRVDRLWTRGDRFFLESSTDQRRFKWGQDANGRVWMTHGRRAGLTYEPNEVPPWLATVCDALSMRLETMLDEVLENCDLTWEENPADPHTKVVRAVNAGGAKPRWLKEARLEIDAETKVLKKLTVVRQVRFRTVTVSYTLAASEAQPDSRYELAGHLAEPFTIYSKTNQPQKRMEVLSDHFGPVFARSLLAPVESESEPKK